jgi:hypothetical protein
VVVPPGEPWKAGNPRQPFGHQQCELSEFENGKFLEGSHMFQTRARDTISAKMRLKPRAVTAQLMVQHRDLLKFDQVRDNTFSPSYFEFLSF